MNNTPNLSPAERLGILIEFLIQALLARACWWLPKWLVAMIVGDLRGIGEAFARLAAQVQANAAEQAAHPIQTAETEAPRKGAAPARSARHGSARRPELADRPAPVPETEGQKAAPPRPAAPKTPQPTEAPLHRVALAHWPGVRVNSKTACFKPVSWHAQLVPL